MNNITRYPGIPPFKPEQKDVFFGRSADTQRLYNLLLTEKTVLLQAKSGLGKSSLINAGLFPLLLENPKAQIYTFRFNNYVENQSLSPVQTIVNTLTQNRSAGSFLDAIIPNENSLYYHFKTLQAESAQPDIFLVFDQFEELFTYPEELVFPFKKQLAEVLHGNLPKHFQIMLDRKRKQTDAVVLNDMETKLLSIAPNIHILFAIRADRLSELEQIADYLPAILRHRFELKPLNREQIAEAIVEPARSKSDFASPQFDYDGQTVQTILKYLTNDFSLPAETTQLQIICQKFEKMAIEKGAGFVVKNEHLPDFKDILREFYDDTISELDKNRRAQAMVFIEDHLIAAGRRISLDKLVCSQYISEHDLEQLEKNHLLRAERNSTGGTSYELAHDTLVAPISEARKTRTEREEEERTERERQAELRLANEKIEKERFEREKERKRQQKLRIIISVAAMISIAFGIFGFINMRKAEQSNNKMKSSYVKEVFALMKNEDFKIAKEKWIFLKDSLGYDDRESIDKRISKCIEMDSLKTLFSNDLIAADKLLSTNKIEDYIKADSLYIEAEKLKYSYGEKLLKEKLTSYKNLKVQVINSSLETAQTFMKAGAFMQKDAQELLKNILKLDPSNKQAKGMVK